MFGPILSLILTALVLSLLLTPLVRKAALCMGLVDLPGARKVHARPIPRIGGLAVFVAYFGSFLATIVIVGVNPLTDSFAALKPFAPAAFLVFLVGLMDDVAGLKPWHKLAAEIVAGLLVVAGGMTVPFMAALPGKPFAAAVCTIVWLVICVNAVNLIDGLDGLASGIAFLATTVILLASLFRGDARLIILVAPLLGTLLGFLVFNFNPASIFLGDSGSLLIGFLLGCYGILWSRQPQTLSSRAVPVIALAVPLIDTSLAILRRFLRAQPIFSPDRSHIHHLLLARGLTQRRAVLILYSATGFAGVVALSLAGVQQHFAPFILVAFAGGTWFAIHRLGYTELDAARRVLTRTAFRREVTGQLAVRRFGERLMGAASPNDCWEAILEGSHEFGFEPIRMHLAGQTFASGTRPGHGSSWDLHLPITQTDWVELAHEPGAEGHANAAIPFIEAIRNLLSQKETTWTPQPALAFAGVLTDMTGARRISEYCISCRN